ncbi:MAG: ATP-dependent endonuclease [Bacteroidia bacterium]
MDTGKVTIQNYRSFDSHNPITIDIEPGITFILGINNIGKSNLLKLFYELRNMLGVRSTQDKVNIMSPANNVNYSNIINQKSESDEIKLIAEFNDVAFTFGIKPYLSNPNNKEFSFSLKKYNYGNSVLSYKELGFVFELFTKSMYVGSFRTPFFQTSANYFDIDIGHTFITTWDNWANGEDISCRNKIRALKNELKELFGFSHFEVSVNQSKTSLLVETDNGSFNLDELGGGVGHFILVLANALIRQPSFILIDEPENALHPKMQEIFIRTLASKAKYGLIATSHSIALARSTADKIYNLSKNDNGRISLTPFGDHYKPSVLNSINELGYSQFVELGGNNILLVEGRTDIKAFKEILRKYNIEQHFIIMDLGGSNFISEKSYDDLSELKRLNAKSYSVIFDSEKESIDQELKEPLKKFKDACETLGFQVFPTEYHSTENYITQDALDKIVGSNHKALGNFENFQKIPNEKKWGKALNWKMFREMNKSDFEGTLLDKFIIDNLLPKINN